MAANTIPIFPKTPKVSWGKLDTANTNMDGTGTVVNIFTAGVNGSRVDLIKVKPLGTNIKTVLRLFLNNGSDNEVSTNNSLFDEVNIPIVWASSDDAMSSKDVMFENLVLPAGYKINATIGTTINAGIQVTVIGGDY